MTRRVLAWVMTSVLLLVPASACIAGDDGDARLPGDDLDEIAGTTWTKDIRITRNSAPDSLPQIVVDGSDVAHVIWQRSGYWTQTFDSHGTALSKEVFITPHVVRGYGSPSNYPLGPQIAIDSRANIHVVWDDGWQNCYYQKFDADANSLTGEIQVGNVDNMASHVPSVAIDPVNDHVHIVHEDYQYQCEDIVYDKLDNDGKVLVNEVSVSSDVSSHCEHSTLTTDQKGNVHVAFGASTGAWWRKVDQNGVARGFSVNLFHSPPYMIADLACTPDGDVHMVWTADGEVRYTRLDNNGTVRNAGVVVSENATNPGPPRIAASTEESTVHIVWHDSRDGNYEVYYARMEDGAFNETPDNIRLTNDTANSLYPWVAVSPEGSVHVVWQDDRDGKGEIYYKFMYRRGMSLGVLYSPDLYWFHPNQTKTLHLYLENQGTLPDDFTAAVTYDGWAESRGWELGLNETVFDDVPGGSWAFFHLTVTSPATASYGECINITVTAESASGDTERLAWRSFVIVERAVSLTCAEPTKLVSPGGDVLFTLTVTNIGDLPDSFRIEYTLIPAVGWDVGLDPEIVELGVDEGAEVTVALASPDSAMANDNATVFVRVQSMTDASVWDGKKLMAFVDPDLHLVMEAPVPTMWVDPAGRVDFPIVVRNVGNLQGKVAIAVSSTEPRPGWGAFISDETVLLAGGEAQAITLTVTAPADALAGSRQTIEVSTVTEDHSSRGSVEVTALVNQVHGLYPAVHTNEVVVHAGEEGEFLVTVTNEGNGNEHVSLGSVLVPDGWRVAFEVDGVDTRDLAIMSMDTETVTVVVSTPPDARAGRSPPLNVVLTDAADRSYVIVLYLRVHQRYGVDLSAQDARGEGAPGGTVIYDLVVTNGGNGEDTFLLGHGPLPGPGWTAGFHGTDGTPVSTVTLAGGERRDVQLWVHIPEGADAPGPLDLLARATSGSAEVDEVKLTLDLRLADLRILSVEYDPGTPKAGGPTHVTIRVANQGTSPAEGVTVVMLEDGRELGREVVGAVGEASAATVTFQWTPSPGKHALTYVVSTATRESDYGNNELVHRRTVDDEASVQDGPAAWAVLLALACLAIAARARRRP